MALQPGYSPTSLSLCLSKCEFFDISVSDKLELAWLFVLVWKFVIVMYDFDSLCYWIYACIYVYGISIFFSSLFSCGFSILLPWWSIEYDAYF